MSSNLRPSFNYAYRAQVPQQMPILSRPRLSFVTVPRVILAKKAAKKAAKAVMCKYHACFATTVHPRFSFVQHATLFLSPPFILRSACPRVSRFNSYFMTTAGTDQGIYIAGIGMSSIYYGHYEEWPLFFPCLMSWTCMVYLLLLKIYLEKVAPTWPKVRQSDPQNHALDTQLLPNTGVGGKTEGNTSQA